MSLIGYKHVMNLMHSANPVLDQVAGAVLPLMDREGTASVSNI